MSPRNGPAQPVSRCASHAFCWNTNQAIQINYFKLENIKILESDEYRDDYKIPLVKDKKGIRYTCILFKVVDNAVPIVDDANNVAEFYKLTGLKIPAK